ncbi:nucleolar protein 12 isoform X1 [Callithrix jacchus]
MGRNKKKRDGDDRRPRLVLSFDEEKRREYLTGFHKRKVERKKAAIEEIKQRLKEEQRKLREERHQEYLKMLAEREEALEEADELDQLVTAKMESVQYDHPNHTVTVTTISDLDLSGAQLLRVTPPERQQVHGLRHLVHVDGTQPQPVHTLQPRPELEEGQGPQSQTGERTSHGGLTGCGGHSDVGPLWAAGEWVVDMLLEGHACKPVRHLCLLRGS